MNDEIKQKLNDIAFWTLQDEQTNKPQLVDGSDVENAVLIAQYVLQNANFMVCAATQKPIDEVRERAMEICKRFRDLVMFATGITPEEILEGAEIGQDVFSAEVLN